MNCTNKMEPKARFRFLRGAEQICEVVMSSEQINEAIATARELIAAGKRATAEGEVIIAQRRKEWPGRAGRPQARLAVPKPMPMPDMPDYILTSTDHDNVKAVLTMIKMTKIGKSASLRAAAYREVGTRLDELRQNRDETQWVDILHRECGLSARRAYELMAMATGAKPLHQLRFETSARVKKHIDKRAA
jgi:hypothetical protein